MCPNFQISLIWYMVSLGFGWKNSTQLYYGYSCDVTVGGSHQTLTGRKTTEYLQC